MSRLFFALVVSITLSAQANPGETSSIRRQETLVKELKKQLKDAELEQNEATWVVDQLEKKLDRRSSDNQRVIREALDAENVAILATTLARMNLKRAEARLEGLRQSQLRNSSNVPEASLANDVVEVPRSQRATFLGTGHIDPSNDGVGTRYLGTDPIEGGGEVCRALLGER